MSQINFIEELRWRGLLHDVMPGTEEKLLEGMQTAYVGFDPTADSLHVGSLLPIMLLVHFQKAGHQPIALVGGATGMVGDPSGKSDERNLLDEAQLNKNVEGVKKQLSHFLDFDTNKANHAKLLNNYDWMKDFSFLDFIRDVGKHITVNYMSAKDSVKKRVETGISFTEFSYQLLQGYDFLHLYRTENCLIQMGGSDQWGNMTTGTELVRRIARGEAFALTCPLLTKADGGKFGKTESGTVWLDPEKTTPYEFYQFWLNATDEDASKLIRTFTLLDQETIEKLEAEHNEAPHLRQLQKTLAEDITVRVHGREAYETAVKASQILFGKSTLEDLQGLDQKTFLAIFSGVQQAQVEKAKIDNGLAIIDALVAESEFMPSNGDARRNLKSNAVSVNKVKVTEEKVLSEADLIAGKYILLQKGKKNYFILDII